MYLQIATGIAQGATEAIAAVYLFSLFFADFR